MDKSEKRTCRACRAIVFAYQICKFVTFSLPSPLSLLKFPIVGMRVRTNQFLNDVSIVTTAAAAWDWLQGPHVKLCWIKRWRRLPTLAVSETLNKTPVTKQLLREVRGTRTVEVVLWSVNPERTFSALRILKSYLRKTMKKIALVTGRYFVLVTGQVYRSLS